MLWVELDNMAMINHKAKERSVGPKTFTCVHGIKTSVRMGREGHGWELKLETPDFILYRGDGDLRPKDEERYYVNVSDFVDKAIDGVWSSVARGKTILKSELK